MRKCCGSVFAWIRIILGSRIRIWVNSRFRSPDSDQHQSQKADPSKLKFRKFGGLKWCHGGPWLPTNGSVEVLNRAAGGLCPSGRRFASLGLGAVSRSGSAVLGRIRIRIRIKVNDLFRTRIKVKRPIRIRISVLRILIIDMHRHLRSTTVLYFSCIGNGATVSVAPNGVKITLSSLSKGKCALAFDLNFIFFLSLLLIFEIVRQSPSYLMYWIYLLRKLVKSRVNIEKDTSNFELIDVSGNYPYILSLQPGLMAIIQLAWFKG